MFRKPFSTSAQAFPVEPSVRCENIFGECSHPSEVPEMSNERKFGVECKNPECGDWIVLGMHDLTRPESRRDLLTYIQSGPWKLTCPTCGDAEDYDHFDLRECLEICESQAR